MLLFLCFWAFDKVILFFACFINWNSELLEFLVGWPPYIYIYDFMRECDSLQARVFAIFFGKCPNLKSLKTSGKSSFFGFSFFASEACILVNQDLNPINFASLQTPILFKITSTPHQHNLNTTSTQPQHNLNTTSTQPQHNLNTTSTHFKHIFNTFSTYFQHIFNIFSIQHQHGFNPSPALKAAVCSTKLLPNIFASGSKTF